MTPVDELATLLRPSGGGVFLLSTGRAEQVAVQKRLYAGELSGADDEAAIHGAFVARLHRLAEARAFLIGAPSDIGAGYRRGANLGPWGIRQALLAERRDWPSELAALDVLDIGDVFVVPQLLHDDTLSESQRAASAAALYPQVDPELRRTLPVSPLSILELVRRLGRITKIIAGDVMEVAPPLGPTPADADRTCKLAASYLRETIYAALGAPPPP